MHPTQPLDLSLLSHASFKARAQTAIKILKQYKWTIGSSIAIGGTVYYAWKVLNSVPMREILLILSQSEGKAEGEVNSVLRGGEGSRLLSACLLDIHGDLSALFDIQEKQAAARSPGNVSVQARVQAFKELSVASFTRTVSAVYALCMLDMFVHIQVFELVKQRRQGSELHDDAQRKYLSVLQGFRSGDHSAVAIIGQRVEASVRRFFDHHSVTEECTANGLRSMISKLRSQIEEDANTEIDEEDSRNWLASLMLEVVSSKISSLEEHQKIRAPFRSAFAQETELQLKQLLETTTEIIESEIFVDALSAALNKAFEALETEIIVRGFGVSDGDHQSHQDGSTVAAIPSIPLIKLVPVTSNLFGSILSLKSGAREDGSSFGMCILQTQESKNLFVVLSSG